ncbi:hypothetical protein [Pseudanabaena sp. ABRG5-3]|uniref:hypothetical protein n=1 Tax=Pseudanabaena sp. ABRG5-3 TaxID=685565 RepID=UPI000DC6F9AA|nr:hypothetical protein [Pseudanabaena sp. ABRG5-3]BBC25418.1 hypothetical protein ABRG53_3161 [Pseudanabaena sp. ABRG5-3]
MIDLYKKNGFWISLCINTVITFVLPCYSTLAVDTPMSGGTGGNSFTLKCNPNQVAVGISGRSSSYVDKLRVICMHPSDVRVNNTSPTQESSNSVGGTGGNQFTRRCEAGSVITGISGRAGWFIDSLKIYCSPFNRNTLMAESGLRELALIGSSSGLSNFGRFNCPNNLPGVGFRGRASWYIDAIALTCQIPSLAPGSLSANNLPRDITQRNYPNVIRFSWTDRSLNETNFVVKITNQETGFVSTNNVAAVSSTGNRVTLDLQLPTLPQATRYTFIVCATVSDISLCSDQYPYYSTGSFETPASPFATTSSPPTNISWSRIGAGTARVFYNHLGGADFFRFYLTSPDTSSILAATVSGTARQADIAPLLATVAYRIKVCAVRGIIEFCASPITIQFPF